MTTPPEDPAAFAAGLNMRLLHCRELGHTWRALTVSWDRAAKAYDRALRCSSCGTVRRQVLSTSGAVLGNRYEYPEGYLAKGVHVGASRDVYRLESVMRAIQGNGRKAG